MLYLGQKDNNLERVPSGGDQVQNTRDLQLPQGMQYYTPALNQEPGPEQARNRVSRRVSPPRSKRIISSRRNHQRSPRLRVSEAERPTLACHGRRCTAACTRKPKPNLYYRRSSFHIPNKLQWGGRPRPPPEHVLFGGTCVAPYP